MGTTTQRPPPPRISIHGEGGWVELVSGLMLLEAARLASELAQEDVPIRSVTEESGVTVLVPVGRLATAQFVLVRSAFNRPETMNAPGAEIGSLRLHRRVRRAALACAIGGILVFSLATIPDGGPEGLRCPGGETMQAPRGGCLETDL